MKYLIKTISGTTVNGSPIITGLSSTDALTVGSAITGTGIPANTVILSIDSRTQVTLDKNASASGTVALIFFMTIKHDGAIPILAIFASSFGGGTVTVQGSPDGGTTWITLTQQTTGTAATFTANAFTQCYEIAMGYLMRATLTGATNPTGVNVALGI